MKKTFLVLAIISLLLAISCNDTAIGPAGPVGPQGPQGPTGVASDNAYVFEYENINFTAPNYDVILGYPDDFVGYNSDVALVYFLWGDEIVDGERLEIWRLLPQTVLFTDGTLQYNYDFTKNDVRLFLGANFPLSELTEVDTDQWVARVVVIPGDFFNGRFDFSNYRELEKAIGIDSSVNSALRVYPERRN
ncbi:MAG: hypothetical protein RIC03_20500 [Cyclobacteriaceae bacterium]